MKKIYLAIATAFMAVSAASAAEPQLPSTPVTPVTAPEGDWVKVSTGVWYDGLPSSLFGNDLGGKWDVDVYENTTTEGWYRVYPYAEGTGYGAKYGNIKEPIDFCVVNPDKVFFEKIPVHGYDARTSCPENGSSNPAYYGTLNDGSIIFDTKMEFSQNNFANASLINCRIILHLDKDNGWKRVSTGIWSGGMASSLFGAEYGGTWDVDVYESTTNKGWYRVYPYAEQGTDFAKKNNSNPFMCAIDFCAADPDKVYFKEVPVLGYTCRTACPEVGSSSSNYGTLKDGVIEFSGNTMEWSQNNTDWTPWNCALTLQLDKNAAISTVESDDTNAPVEYFNLQGVKIENPAPGQIVIRRQGSKTTKVIR